jgi:hypothetical protein
MVRLKCKKCDAVFDQGFGGAVFSPHVGRNIILKSSRLWEECWFNYTNRLGAHITNPNRGCRKSL